jgi:hypothetical protein
MGYPPKEGMVEAQFLPLCKNECESVDHLFIYCAFSKQVWEKIVLILNLQTSWDGNSLPNCFDNWVQKEHNHLQLPSSLPNCFDNWVQKEHNHLQLPSLICWTTCLERNKGIFENRTPSVSAAAYKAIGIFNTWNVAHAHKPTLQHSPKEPVLYDTHIRWFEGAVLSDGSQIGVGGLINSFKTLFTNGHSTALARAPIPGLSFWVFEPHYFWPPDSILMSFRC